MKNLPLKIDFRHNVALRCKKFFFRKFYLFLHGNTKYKRLQCYFLFHAERVRKLCFFIVDIFDF